MKLYIVAVLRFKESDLIEAIELLKKLTHETKKEEGCLQYDVVEDRQEKGVFFITELWETAEHHHQHSVSEHIDEFRRNSSKLIESKEV